ncbi:head-tail connector protein [Pseudoroseicyclus sp. H15]
MILVEETGVDLAALPVAGLKAHLRLGTGFADGHLQDEVLEGFVRAALAAIEARTGKVLIARDFLWTRESWSATARQPLPVAPVSEILSVAVTDGEGVATSVAPEAWRLVEDTSRPVLEARGGALPSIPSGGQVAIRFTAGFGPDFTDLPADLAQAVLMLAAHYYEFRHDTKLGAGCMPFGVSALIERYRNVRLFGGQA